MLVDVGGNIAAAKRSAVLGAWAISAQMQQAPPMRISAVCEAALRECPAILSQPEPHRTLR
jgi:hypothetical protein